MLTLFPFEAAFYEQHNVPACFVGHPLADLIPLVPDQNAAKAELNLDPTQQYIALLPGSRRNEIRFLGEVFLQTALRCWQENPRLQFITSSANAERNKEFQALCEQRAPDLPIHFFENRSPCRHGRINGGIGYLGYGNTRNNVVQASYGNCLPYGEPNVSDCPALSEVAAHWLTQFAGECALSSRVCARTKSSQKKWHAHC